LRRFIARPATPISRSRDEAAEPSAHWSEVGGEYKIIRRKIIEHGRLLHQRAAA